MRRRPSRLAVGITAAFLLGGATLVVFAVRGVVLDVTDDTSWVAIVSGLSLVTWGVAFHRLGSDDGHGHEADDDGPLLRDGVGSAALFAMAGTGAYWASRSLFGHSATVAIAIAATIVGLQVLNRWLDAVLARRRADGAGSGAAGLAVDDH